MINILGQEHEAKLQSKRMQYALKELRKRGFEVECFHDVYLQFIFKGQLVKFYPYSGWHTGKSIEDGMGIQKLLEQLNETNPH